MVFYWFFWVIFLVAVFLLISLLLSWMFINFSINKSSSFECGFDSFFSSGSSFSISFFCICLMFLLFDVELVLLGIFPFYFSIFQGFYLLVMIMVCFFVSFTTFYEWYNGLLQWV